MPEIIRISAAEQRDRAGKGAARATAAVEGRVPAVIYGDKQPPRMIAVEPQANSARAINRAGLLQRRSSISTVDGKVHRTSCRATCSSIR